MGPSGIFGDEQSGGKTKEVKVNVSYFYEAIA